MDWVSEIRGGEYCTGVILHRWIPNAAGTSCCFSCLLPALMVCLEGFRQLCRRNLAPSQVVWDPNSYPVPCSFTRRCSHLKVAPTGGKQRDDKGKRVGGCQPGSSPSFLGTMSWVWGVPSGVGTKLLVRAWCSWPAGKGLHHGVGHQIRHFPGSGSSRGSSRREGSVSALEHLLEHLPPGPATICPSLRSHRSGFGGRTLLYPFSGESRSTRCSLALPSGRIGA